MEIKLNWNNETVGLDSIKVYRSTTTFSKTTLPEPLAIISGQSTSFSDESVVRGVTYYYRLGSYKGQTASISSEIVATAEAYSGVGPQTLVVGDYSKGYFGKMEAGDFISFSEFATYLGVSSAIPTIWFKYAHKGKILIIAGNSIMSRAWQDLYLKGLVYGTNDFGDVEKIPSHIAKTNQLTTIRIKGQLYKIRLMTGRGVDPTEPIVSGTVMHTPFNPITATMSSSYTTNKHLECEWDELILATSSTTPSSFRGEKFDKYPFAISNVLCQELLTPGSNSVVTRGVTLTSASTSNRFALGYYATGYAVNSALPWMPVLEWIPE